MVKRLILLAVLFALVSSFTFGDTDLSLLFNNNLIDLDHAPLQVEGDFMVPMEEVFSSMGVQYSYAPDSQMITAYRDNIFLKYFLGSNTYYLNGKSFISAHAPFTAVDTVYLPLSTITRALDIESTYDPERRLIIMKNYAIQVFKTYTNYFYHTIEIPEFNVSFDIPYYWEALDETGYRYGIQSDYENNQVAVYALTVSEDMTIDRYVDNLYDYLRNLMPDDNLTALDEQEYSSGGFRGVYATFSSGIQDEKLILGYYVTQVEDVLYILTLTFQQADSSYLEIIADNIIKSFHIQSFTVNTAEEHYIEYPKVYTQDMKLTRELYSNQQHRDFVYLDGSIDPSVERILATVSKNQESLTFLLPVTEGTFGGRVYLPFGLGKHNLTLAVDRESEIAYNPDRVDLAVESSLLIKCSVLNISPEFIRHTIPDPGIISDHEHLVSMARFLTYELPTNYAKAYKLYTYIMENIRLNPGLFDSDPYEVYLTLEGSPQAIAYYYASLARSIQIPARIYRGISELDLRYWVELYINGSWIVVDPVLGLTNKDQGTSDPNDGFLIRPEVYYQQFEEYEEITH